MILTNRIKRIFFSFEWNFLETKYHLPEFRLIDLVEHSVTLTYFNLFFFLFLDDSIFLSLLLLFVCVSTGIVYAYLCWCLWVEKHHDKRKRERPIDRQQHQQKGMHGRRVPKSVRGKFTHYVGLSQKWNIFPRSQLNLNKNRWQFIYFLCVSVCVILVVCVCVFFFVSI